MSRNILIKKEENVTAIWLNRPEAKNAFNPEMIEELITAFSELSQAETPLPVLLRGANHQFCAGADIRWMQASGKQSPLENARESERIADLLKALYQYPAPTLALAEGTVLGGALGLLAVCDLVLAVQDAVFGLPEVHLGIAPAIILPYLIQRVPPHKILHKALTGKRFSAEEALAMGLIDELIHPSVVEEKLKNQIRDLNQPSAQAQREVKRLTRLLQQNPGPGVIMEAVNTLSRLKSSEDGQEGLRAFLEKRKPEWK